MGSIVIGTIVDLARRRLFELKVGQTSATDRRFSRTLELLPLGNMACEMICAHNPGEYVLPYVHALAEGAEQTIATDARQLGAVLHNLGDDGETPGNAINIIDRLALTRINPNWMNKIGDEVEFYVYDQKEKRKFFVYPRPPDPWYVRLSCPAVPPEISAANIDHATNGLIPVDNIFRTPIIDFIVGYAVLKNFRATDYNKAAFHLQRFERATGIELEKSDGYMPLDQAAAEGVPDALGKT